MASSSSSAGRSAQREHDRRRRLDDERRRKTLVARVVVTVLTPVVVLLAVRFGAAALEAAIERQTGRSIDADQRPLVSDGQVAVIALLLAAGATLTVVQRLWLRPATTAAWAKGAEGERRTARLLDRLPADYRVLHDLRLPRTRANIDHLVIGPTGVITVESKQYRQRVRVGRGEVRVGGRRAPQLVEQPRRQAEAVRAVLGTDVRPVVVVHGSGVDLAGWSSRATVDGVWFCSGGRLRKVITGRPRVLTPDDVHTLTERASRLLPGR
jgi:hypothetical protein